MTPDLACHDVADRCFADAIFSSQYYLLLSKMMSLTNLQDVSFSELGCRYTLSKSEGTIPKLVHAVFRFCLPTLMCPVPASGVVTWAMGRHHQWTWSVAVVGNTSKNMNLHGFAIDRQVPISLEISCIWPDFALISQDPKLLIVEGQGFSIEGWSSERITVFSQTVTVLRTKLVSVLQGETSRNCAVTISHGRSLCRGTARPDGRGDGGRATYSTGGRS